MTQRHTTPRHIQATEKALLALQLRKQGFTLEEIARQCGYQDKSGPWRAIKRELDRMVAPEVEDLRKLEEMRLDDMLKVCYPQAQNGSLWAVDRVVAISERRSRLMGLDAKVDGDSGGVQIIIEETPMGYLGPEVQD